MRDDARVLVSLTVLAGERLVSAEVRGTGEAPRRALVRGLFLPE